MQWANWNLSACPWALLVAVACCALQASAADVRWLVAYEGDALPQAPQWTRLGGKAGRAELAGGSLHLVDDSDQEQCCYRATWEPDPACETVVEARVRVVSVTAWRGRSMHWPWRDGSPVSILVSDGQHQEGLALCPERIGTWMDRFCMMRTTDNFHVYRLVIRGQDMSVSVDGKQVIRGKDAFWKPAGGGKPFLQFGSSSKRFKGEAHWDYVKLGVRPARPSRRKEKLKITLSKPWRIPRFGGVRSTRPYLYDVGEGILLMSVAQGPDAVYEPYGVLKSTDKGKTWTPVEGLQEKVFAPQPMVRMGDGSILGASRWILKFRDKGYAGISYRFDRKADSFQIHESRILMSEKLKRLGNSPVFDRHIFRRGDGSVLAVLYDQYAGYLVRTTDRGRTWKFASTIGKGHEPGVAFFSETEAIALLRQGSMRPLHQVRSHDGGKTWTKPRVLEAGSVDPDVVTMSNGVLACSYGRPGSNVMFSTNQGKTWDCYRVITDRPGFNYTTIREVSPGRLLYVHDAPPLTALYIAVELVK